MALQISSATPDELTLTMATPRVGCARIMLIGFGSVGLLVGGGLLAMRYPQGIDIVNLLATVFVLMGTGFTIFAFFINGTAPTGLAALVFDRRLGAVRVRSAAGRPDEAYLRYADIAGVEVETRSHTSSAGNSGHSSTSRTYTYHAVLRLQDGAKWVLTEDSTRAAADELQGRLTAALQAGAPAGAKLSLPELPPQLVHSTQGSATTLRWQNQVTGQEVAGRLLVLAFFGGVLGLFFAIVLSQNLPGTLLNFAFGVLGLIALMFVFIAVTQLKRLRQDAKNRYLLVFTPAEVTYLEESLATGQVTHRESVALADWYGLSYALDTTGQENEAVLLLSKAAHQQYVQQQTVVSVREGLRLLMEKEQSRALYFKQFSPTQRLALVNWARAETARRLAAC